MNKKPEHIFDEWLILRYQAGEKRALKLLVQRWHPKIVARVYGHTQDASASKDIAQDCWYAIIKGIPSITNPRLFGAWAQTIASRKAIDWIRSRQKDRRQVAGIEEMRDLKAETTENSQQDNILKLRVAIKTLPEKQKVVLNLFYMEGYNLDEISGILKISRGTVKSRLFHAREFLKQTLRGDKNEK